MWGGQKHLRTGPRPRRGQQSSRTGCLRCCCWCWFKGGLKRSAMFTFDTSVLRITHRKPLKGLQKLSKEVRTVYKWADPPKFVHSGFHYLKRNSFSRFLFVLHRLWYGLLFGVQLSPIQLASICCLRDQRLPKLMGVLDCFNGKVLRK